MPRFFARELDLVDDAEHLVVLADEALRLARPQPHVQRRDPAAAALAGDRQAGAVSVADLPCASSRTRARYSIFFGCVQLTDVGRVDDDQRVLMDVTRAQTGDSVGNFARCPRSRASGLSLSSSFFIDIGLVERAGDPVELHVLRRLYPVDHVAHELAERLGKPGESSQNSL